MKDDSFNQVAQAITFITNELVKDTVEKKAIQLRDGFAEAALGSLIQKGVSDPQAAALAAYAYADAMMKVREPQPSDSTESSH